MPFKLQTIDGRQRIVRIGPAEAEVVAEAAPRWTWAASLKRLESVPSYDTPEMVACETLRFLRLVSADINKTERPKTAKILRR